MTHHRRPLQPAGHDDVFPSAQARILIWAAFLVFLAALAWMVLGVSG